MDINESQSRLIIDETTILSLLATVFILLVAYISSLRLLSPTINPKLRILFIWHAFDALIHFILEGSFLYNCFFTYITIPIPSSIGDYPHPASLGASTGAVHFLGHSDRLYGSRYGDSFMTRLWMEYAKADRRWGDADLTVVSLELLTVLVAGPLAIYVCELIRRRDGARLWFWGSVLATAELYGGFMTFAPEWLCGSPNLDTSNFMYLWVYLVFFNTLWVGFPLWVLYEAQKNIAMAFAKVEREPKKNL